MEEETRSFCVILRAIEQIKEKPIRSDTLGRGQGLGSSFMVPIHARPIMGNQIIIDGSIGEGGGQVLRTSLALSALLERPLVISNIRVGRRRPGLRPQHLAAVRALARITAAELRGDAENSTSLVFMPRRISGGNYRFSIGTAGSVCLLAAAILPPLLFAPHPSVVVLEGGTHVPFSPVFHYLEKVFLPILRRMGAEINVTLDSWGWYPRGDGSCTLRITPCQGLQALHLPYRGRLCNLTLMLGLAGLPLHIIDREESRVRMCLEETGYVLERQFEAAPSPGQGNVLFLRGEYEEGVAGFSTLGKKGWPAEEVADDLCRQFLDFDHSNGSVDQHLADQVLLYLALAKGDSLFTAEKVTSHLMTNIEIIEKFLPVRFMVDPAVHSVMVTGTAFTVQNKEHQ